MFNTMVDSREIIKAVDDLMYSVKRAGKNSVEFGTWPKE